MATQGEKDPVTGRYTTGHEWDGIKELNTPLPKWWVWVFYVCILWGVGYWVFYPAIPVLSDYTKGTLGWSAREEFHQEMAAVEKSRSAWMTNFETAAPADIKADPTLLQYAMAGGKSVFNENCAPCHGTGGAGAYGYPTLADDEWIWGGSMDDIQQTISYGVRNTHDDSRQSDMPAFGEILAPQEVDQVADYVLSLSNGGDAASPGATVYADNCAACHGEQGEGMAAVGAPALNNSLWLFKGTKEGVVAQIAKPKHGSMPAWSERLDENTIKMLTVYVHTLGGGQ